jgi:hypothetical protein
MFPSTPHAGAAILALCNAECWRVGRARHTIAQVFCRGVAGGLSSNRKSEHGACGNGAGARLTATIDPR